MLITFLCIIIGKATIFTVKINGTQYVDKLKDVIKQKLQPTLDKFAADQLTLYKVNITFPTKELLEAAKKAISKGSIEYKKLKLEASFKLEDYFQDPPPEKVIHILIQLPQGESIDPRSWWLMFIPH
jgi:hypothetical protein